MEANAPIQALTEDGIKTALIEARGDIFVASQMLGVTALRIHRAIRVSGQLQTVATEISERKADPSFEKLSTEALESSVRERQSLYRDVGLDAQHDLATMPIDDNSAQNQVKLSAAARLAGSSDAGTGGNEIADTLRALNEAYQSNAPRIRIVRQTLSVEVASGERAVDQSDS